MHRQYVSNATVNFSDFKLFVRPGDICSHNEVTNDFVIYRNGELVATIKTSVMALKAMMTAETGYFTLVDSPVIPVIPETTVVVVDEEDAPPVVINEPEDDEVVIFGDDPGTEEEEDATVTHVAGMENAAEAGTTITLVDLNEEKTPEQEVIITKDPEKIKAIAEAQAKVKPARRPKP